MMRSARYGVAILLSAVMIGAVAFFAASAHKTQLRQNVLVDNLPELEWVRGELGLSNEQFEKVRELHVDYRPECVEMCDRIHKAHARLVQASREADGLTPELKAAIEHHARVQAECREAMLAHLYETAAVLDETQANHYLKLMLPFALDLSHSGPGGIHGK